MQRNKEETKDDPEEPGNFKKRATLIKQSLDGELPKEKPEKQETSKFASKNKEDDEISKESEKSVKLSDNDSSKKEVKKKKQLPPLKKVTSPSKDIPQKKVRSKTNNKNPKSWVSKMPPTIGHNIRKDVPDLPEYDEEKFCIYSVFREKILDKIIREQLMEMAKE